MESKTKLNKEKLLELLKVNQFPLSAKYDPEWVLENEMGPSSLWLTESLCQVMELKPGMRVLDLGCGKAISSIFLSKEYGLEVWATDLWINATDNWKRIQKAGVEKHVFPIYAEAHSLPYAENFFDAIISVDSYQYYGTDEMYFCDHFVKLVKPNGQIGIIVAGLTKEFNHEIPQELRRFWEAEYFSWHSAEWWRWHWEKTGTVNIEVAESIPEGWNLWMKWENLMDESGYRKPGRNGDTALLRADNDNNLGFVRMVARRK